MFKHKFIAFEGIDGSGKSSQIKLLGSNLQNLGEDVYLTAEPTNGPIGKMIRDIFSNKIPADQHTIAALFVADRIEHIVGMPDGMKSQLEMGKTVLTDRYYLSSYAYHGTHIDMDWVIECNRKAVDFLKPDIHLFIDVDPEESMLRIRQSRNNIEMYETLENLKKVRNKYFEAFDKCSKTENIVIINGNQPQEMVAKEILKVLK